MIDWYKKVVFENYANFSGRARRSEYWYFTLMSFIISIITGLIDSMLNLKYGVNSVYGLVVMIPTLAVSVRRLHDVGKSGWLLLITYGLMISLVVVMLISGFATGLGGGDFGFAFIIPILGIIAIGIWMLVLFFTEGDRGPNKYGPDPKGFGEEINEIGAE